MSDTFQYVWDHNSDRCIPTIPRILPGTYNLRNTTIMNSYHIREGKDYRTGAYIASYIKQYGSHYVFSCATVLVLRASAYGAFKARARLKPG